MTDIITAATAWGFSSKDGLKIYKYISKDAGYVKNFYSNNEEDQNAALTRLDKVAAKFFNGMASELNNFFLMEEDSVKGLINEMGL